MNFQPESTPHQIEIQNITQIHRNTTEKRPQSNNMSNVVVICQLCVMRSDHENKISQLMFHL